MKTIMYYIKQLHAFSGIQLYLNMTGMVISGLLESAAVLLLIPMLSIAGIQLGGQGAYFHFSIFDKLQELPQILVIFIVLAIYLSIVFGQNLISRSVMIRNVDIQQRFSQKLRFEVYSALLRAEWPFFLKKRTSDLVNLMTSESARVISGINYFLQFISSLLFTLVQIGFAFWLSPQMTLVVLGCGLALSLFSRKFIRSAKKLGGRTSLNGQAYLAGITDQLNGIKDIKSNNLESSRLEWLQTITQAMLDEQIEYMRLRMSSQLLYKMSSALLIAAFIFMSFQFLHMDGPYLLLVILIFARLWPTFTTLQSLLEQLASMLPSFKALQQLQEECLEHAEKGIRPHEEQSITPIRMENGLEVKEVSFRYHADVPVYSLQDINVFIPANRMTAVVGRSGAGKSTLIDLIMGLMQPEAGEIRVDGKLITGNNLLPFRRSIGYVAQDPFLYNASIRDNLMMIKPDSHEDELWEALEFASCADFVRKLPEGIDTLIGDRGVRLSGGERQRLVLARAMIRKPSILVLDEATSALDTENEKKIQEALERLKHSITIIVIAHRLSTIRNADQILVIDNGHVVQQGMFTGLASEQGGIFRSLLSNQEEAM